jgi:DNA-binding CsgD family transcriptional regulator
MAALLQELSGSQLRRALAVVSNVADESHDSGAFIDNALDQLTSLVPSDLTTLSLCDLERGTRAVFGRQGETLSQADRDAFNHHFRQHPLVRFHGTHPGGPTQRISDCLAVRQFRSSPVYADYYRRIGIRHVMALPLRIDARNVISIVFNRSSSDFKNCERALLEGVRPALAALYRNLAVREAACICLAQITDLAACGSWQMLRVTTAGRILDAPQSGLRLLEVFFPREKVAASSQLPGALKDWLLRSRVWGLDRLSAAAGGHFTMPRGGERLTAHFVAGLEDATGYLLIKSERTRASAEELAPLPLTSRERQVLAFVAAGKTNADIALLLSVSPRTVQKHLEHIFDKLGVETRTAAAMRALAAIDEHNAATETAAT